VSDIERTRLAQILELFGEKVVHSGTVGDYCLGIYGSIVSLLKPRIGSGYIKDGPTTFHCFLAQVAVCANAQTRQQKPFTLWSIHFQGPLLRNDNTERLPQCDPQKDVSSVLRMTLIPAN
jgi:hypothetical protein